MKLFLIFWFLFSSLLSFSQSKLEFVNHLKNNELIKEWEFLIFNDTMSIPKDSLAFYRADYYLYRGEQSQIIKEFKEGKTLIMNDKSLYIKLNLFFLDEIDSIKSRWFYNEIIDCQDTLSKQFKNIAAISFANKEIDTALIPIELKKSYAEWLKYYNKKSFVSALYSTLLPGLGKIYNGRKYSFRNVLAAHVLLGAKFLESNFYLGFLNPYTLLTLGFYSTYYIADIVGSYHDLIKVKKEKQKQFSLDVKNYYLSISNN